MPGKAADMGRVDRVLLLLVERAAEDDSEIWSQPSKGHSSDEAEVDL